MRPIPRKTSWTEVELDEPFLTVRDVARRVGVSERTVRNWIKSKRLKAKRIGGVIRIMGSDLKRSIKPKI
jgi:excisionase family DNA binding protein